MESYAPAHDATNQTARFRDVPANDKPPALEVSLLSCAGRREATGAREEEEEAKFVFVRLHRACGGHGTLGSPGLSSSNEHSDILANVAVEQHGR